MGETPFVTTDTSLAAFLITQKYKLIEIQYEPRSNPNGRKRGTFIFEASDTIREDVNLFTSGQAGVNLAAYEHAKSGLLDRVMRELP